MPDTPRLGTLIAVIASFVLLGFPLVYVLWGAVNAVLSLNLGAIRWPLVLPALVAFILLLAVLARVARSYGGREG